MKVVASLNSWIILLVISTFFIKFTLAETECNSTSQCPESSPCCSQYGVCGTGSYCLGGCDIRYSFNLTSCMPMPRMSELNTSFTSTDLLKKDTKYLGNSSEIDWVYSGYIDTHNDALLLQMPNGTSGTVVSSTEYLWYGKITAKLKTSRGGGVVTAFILFSDVQDEIDYEAVGYNLTSIESNFYSLGITDYENSDAYNLSSTFKNYHTYEVDWQEEKIVWSIDGNKLRTLTKSDTWNDTTNRYDFPQTPSRIQFSLWPGGASSNSKGTIEWAGGAVDWNSEDMQDYGYYYAYLKEVTVQPYDLPDNALLDGDDDESKLNAFLYNSTDGNSTDIYLVKKKTWLGSDDATGFAPDNDDDDDDDDDDTTTVISGTGSLKSTKVKTNTKSKSKSTSKSSSTSTTSATTDESYDTSNAIGGFVQSTLSSSKSSKSDGTSFKAQSLIGILLALSIGILSFMV